MKILLYAIFTNEYKKLIPLWIEHTASKFFPKESDVIIFTDDTSVIKETDRIKVKLIESSPYRNEELWAKNERHCEILDTYKDSYDLFVNLQSNCLLTKIIDSSNFSIDKEKLSVFAHVSYPHCSEILRISMAKVGSCAYKSLASYDDLYVHGGMTMGDYAVMKQMNEDCYKMLQKDYEKGKLHKVKYHDETYLNSWRVDNKDKVNVLYDLSYGKISRMDDCDKTFYLIDKEEAKVKSKQIVAPFLVPDSRLGNCLFTFFAAYAHAKRNGYEFHCPYSPILKNIFDQRMFNPNIDNVKGFYKEPTYSYTPIPSSISGWIGGFFQSSKYFSDYKDDVRSMLISMWGGVHSDKSKAAIHVRLGDYLSEQWRFRSPSKDFINNALSHLSSDITTVEVFSDEPQKAFDLVKSVPLSKNFKIILNDEEDEIGAIRAMISSSEFIMSCSSFSWWAAYLGNFSKVIVDKKWYNDGLNTKDLYEDNWLRI